MTLTNTTWRGISLGPCSNSPGFRTLVHDNFLWFPFRARGINPGPTWSFYSKYRDYAKAGLDIVVGVRVSSRPCESRVRSFSYFSAHLFLPCRNCSFDLPNPLSSESLINVRLCRSVRSLRQSHRSTSRIPLSRRYILLYFNVVGRAEVSQEIIGARARFPKPISAYQILATFGSNILVTEGDEWKRQRKIAAPAFSEVRSACFSNLWMKS